MTNNNNLILSVKEWFSNEKYVSRGSYSVSTIANRLGVTTNKIYSILRKAEWSKSDEQYFSDSDRKYYVYRYIG